MRPRSPDSQSGHRPVALHLLAPGPWSSAGIRSRRGIGAADRLGAFGDAERGDGDDRRIALEVCNVNLVRRQLAVESSAWLVRSSDRRERGDTFHKKIEIVGSQSGVEDVMTRPPRFDGLHRFPHDRIRCHVFRSASIRSSGRHPERKMIAARARSSSARCARTYAQEPGMSFLIASK